jgi:phosphoglucosamine mutase
MHHSIKLWPEVMQAVLTNGANAKKIEMSDQVQDALATVRERYQNAARVIVRASGTEPVIRVWTEARQAADASAIVGGLADTVTSLTAK